MCMTRNFPRKVYNDATQLLSQLNLGKQIMLHIEADDESD